MKRAPWKAMFMLLADELSFAGRCAQQDCPYPGDSIKDPCRRCWEAWAREQVGEIGGKDESE